MSGFAFGSTHPTNPPACTVLSYTPQTMYEDIQILQPWADGDLEDPVRRTSRSIRLASVGRPLKAMTSTGRTPRHRRIVEGASAL
jgi:hypothetical protein